MMLLKKNTLKNIMSHKIMFISKFASMLRKAREKNEKLIKIKGMCTDKLIPDEMLEECAIEIKDSRTHYFLASKYDSDNERRPPQKA